MTIDPTNPDVTGIVNRAKAIILQPQAEWDRIAGEPADVTKIYTGYVLPLVALAAACSFIGMTVFGVFGFRYGLVTGLTQAILQVIMGLGGVFVMAFVTNALAPSFGSQQDMGQAHKLAAYGSTPSFLAGVFSIFPPLALLGILGLYSIALLYIGLPRLMKTPEDKRLGYTAVIVIVLIVIGIVMSAVLGAVSPMRGMMGRY